MKKTLLALGVVLCTLSDARAQRAGEFGAGVVLGNPSGFTFKYWRDGIVAFDGGVGYSGDVAFYADAVWHAWDVFAKPRDARVAGYFSAGPRVELADDGEFGIRALAGLLCRPRGRPLEFFVEAGPVFRLTQGGHIDVDGGVGLRVYFGGARRTDATKTGAGDGG